MSSSLLGIQGTHAVPAKAKCERRRDGQQSDLYVLPCFAGTTKVCALLN